MTQNSPGCILPSSPGTSQKSQECCSYLSWVFIHVLKTLQLDVITHIIILQNNPELTGMHSSSSSGIKNLENTTVSFGTLSLVENTSIGHISAYNDLMEQLSTHHNGFVEWEDGGSGESWWCGNSASYLIQLINWFYLNTVSNIITAVCKNNGSYIVWIDYMSDGLWKKLIICHPWQYGQPQNKFWHDTVAEVQFSPVLSPFLENQTGRSVQCAPELNRVELVLPVLFCSVLSSDWWTAL